MHRKMKSISWHLMILRYDLGHSLDLVVARTQPITPAKVFEVFTQFLTISSQYLLIPFTDISLNTIPRLRDSHLDEGVESRNLKNVFSRFLYGRL